MLRFVEHVLQTSWFNFNSYFGVCNLCVCLNCIWLYTELCFSTHWFKCGGWKMRNICQNKGKQFNSTANYSNKMMVKLNYHLWKQNLIITPSIRVWYYCRAVVLHCITCRLVYIINCWVYESKSLHSKCINCLKNRSFKWLPYTYLPT